LTRLKYLIELDKFKQKEKQWKLCAIYSSTPKLTGLDTGDCVDMYVKPKKDRQDDLP
jgi:hypothetical protein